MKLRTVFILVAMMLVVVATSAFGVYNDREIDDDIPKHHNNKNIPASAPPSAPDPESTVVGAAGAGTSYKHSKSHLDVSEKADGPYIKDGTNTYRGKASGYDLHGHNDSDSENSDGGGDGNDSNDRNYETQTEFQKKKKYISKMFDEIFSKWKSNETIMAPSGIEELVDPDEGFKVREKFKKGARQGMRKLKNAFRGRFN